MRSRKKDRTRLIEDVRYYDGRSAKMWRTSLVLSAALCGALPAELPKTKASTANANDGMHPLSVNGGVITKPAVGMSQPTGASPFPGLDNGNSKHFAPNARGDFNPANEGRPSRASHADPFRLHLPRVRPSARVVLLGSSGVRAPKAVGSAPKHSSLSQIRAHVMVHASLHSSHTAHSRRQCDRAHSGESVARREGRTHEQHLWRFHRRAAAISHAARALEEHAEECTRARQR